MAEDDEIMASSIDDLFSDDIYDAFDWEDIGDYEIAEYEGGADYE